MKVIGGTNVNLCRDGLSKNPHIVVGTPGRILDMIRRRYLPTINIKLLTFDELDEILSQGFKEDIYNIIQTVDKNAQICIFSAILPNEILELTDKFMNNPERILVKRRSLTLEGIQQFFININHVDWKYDVIVDLYDTINIGQCIIYMNSKQKIVDVYNRLTKDNFPVDYISSDRTVDERNQNNE